jgi:threonine dehydratase
MLSDAEAEKGVCTHSSGNHAQAVAYAALKRGIPAYIVMPNNSPDVKLEAVKGYGANITLCEPTLEARQTTLEKITEKTGAEVIHPFNNSNVIAGQGTVALEMIEDLGNLDAIIAPIGGGGLMSGTCITTRSLLPNAKLFGAEPKGADDAYRSLKEGKILPQESPNTICDGLLTSLGENTWNILKDHLNAIYTVSDDEVIKAMKLIWERMKIIIEPSCATPVAVVMSPEFRELKGIEKIGIILTGGNIDLSKIPF